MTDDAYDNGDPKRSDYRGPIVCTFCGCASGHYKDCVVAGL